MNCCLLLLVLLYSSGNGNGCMTSCNRRNCFNARPVLCGHNHSHQPCHNHQRQNACARKSDCECNEIPACERVTNVCQTPPPVAKSNFPYLDKEHNSCGCEN